MDVIIVVIEELFLDVVVVIEVVVTGILSWWSTVGPNGIPGIPGFWVDQNPGIFYYKIPGFFGICLNSVKGLFKVRQDLLPRPLEVKIFSQ